MIFNKIKKLFFLDDLFSFKNEVKKKITLNQNLIIDLHHAFESIYIMNKISISINKGVLSSALRKIDETNPYSWEFSAFSQNGEDGIMDFLLSNLKNSNQYFIEVGASNGIECNSAYLAFVKGFSGIMIDGDHKSINIAKSVSHNLGVKYVQKFINLENLNEINELALYSNPDVFSWDTDGNDFYFVEKLFQNGFRPKIFVVEYNSVFGPNLEMTVDYDEDFDFKEKHTSHLYYGCSISLWRKFFKTRDYQFITVDSKGVNGFFVDKNEFNEDFLTNIRGENFKENFYQLSKFSCQWEQQFELIKHMNFKKY